MMISPPARVLESKIKEENCFYPGLQELCLPGPLSVSSVFVNLQGPMMIFMILIVISNIMVTMIMMITRMVLICGHLPERPISQLQHHVRVSFSLELKLFWWSFIRSQQILSHNFLDLAA